MKKQFLLLVLLLSVFPFLELHAQTPAVTIGTVKVDDFGADKLFYRLSDRSDLLIDEASMCFEMSVNYNARNLNGKRVFCVLTPVDSEGYCYSDNVGSASSLQADDVRSADYNGSFHIIMPHQWLITKDAQKSRQIRLMVEIFTVEDNGLSVEKEVVLKEEDLKLDNSKLPGKIMSDIFSGSGSDAIGGLLDGLFGGSSASSTQKCPACDGTRLCQGCDGVGFFFPEECRKCSNHPGVCRRCKGTGTETVKVDFHESLF